MTKRYYLIDHKILFFFGYVFYLFTPYFVGVSDIFHGFPGMDIYQDFFKKIPENKLVSYAQITFLWLPAFYLGHFCFKMLKPYKMDLQLFQETPTSRDVRYIPILLFLVLLVFAYVSRASLFGGYGSFDIGARGKMSTLLVIYCFFLAYQMLSKRGPSYILILGLIITGLLLLSMGGRMYVIQAILVFLICKTSFATKRFKIYQIFGVLAIGLFLATFIGLWRMRTSFNLTHAAYSLFAEPVFTWFSTSSFLTSNDIPLFNIPKNFLTSFLNLIPNTFVNLQSYAVSTQSMAVNYQSPLGADSIWTNIVINFGSVGSFFFLFITGFMLNFLRHNSENSRFAAAYYIMVCSMLPFQFFRDGFYLLNKQLFFNFLILPAILIFLFRFLHYVQALELPSLSPKKSILINK